MRYLLCFLMLQLLASACFGQQPTPTPIPRIKCYPIESNGKVIDWRCVDVPPECIIDRTKKLPKRPGVV